MSGVRERAMRPEDLNRFVVERLNAGDVDGLVALYEPDAVLALPGGAVASGARGDPRRLRAHRGRPADVRRGATAADLA
ncbi:hypothetical protein SAMN05421630_105375 [Prauserella marina]|uniref:Uncharacterized protein n=1 Tax=Prauserella marina TaxID=530584 RepID=A0A1G6RMV1_9PSEU|nr:hypothetical protein DES30_105374 [Prauserella marina]SDD05733.1 hypothetical protein SAMN05421630_105375 [Prauserella marina]